MVVTRKLFSSWRISIPLYGSYKEILSKLWNVNITLWYLQANCLKVAEYEYHCMVVYKEIFSKLPNMNINVW